MNNGALPKGLIPMQFSEVLASLVAEADAYSVNVSEGWTQGRSAFGGLQAAIAVTAMRQQVTKDVPLRTLQVTFIAPVPPGRLRVTATVLRSGRSATHVEARIFDGDQIACLAIGIFGRGRDSVIRVAPEYVPAKRTPQEAPQLPFIEGVTPSFTRHIEFRWAAGGFPFSGAPKPRTQIYLRMMEGRDTGEAEIIALADAIPSPGLSVLKVPAPASSSTWTLEFLTTEYDRSPDGHWLFSAEVTAGSDGYLNQSGTLWSPDGRAVALSRQSVVVFG
jgi:acyl-CoA thioesterase